MSEYISLVLTSEEAEALRKFLRKRPYIVSSTEDQTELLLQSIEGKLKEDAANGTAKK